MGKIISMILWFLLSFMVADYFINRLRLLKDPAAAVVAVIFGLLVIWSVWAGSRLF